MLHFTLLGSVGVEDEHHIRRPIGSGKTQTLFASLLFNAGNLVTTQQLRAELWPDCEAPKTAGTAIQVYVSKLRRSLSMYDPEISAESCIRTMTNGYSLCLAGHQYDLAEFRDLVSRSRAAEQEDDLCEASRHMHQALSLWHGSPLGNVTCGPTLSRAAQTLTELRIAAFERRIELDLRLGQHADLIGEIYALVSEFPLWERAYIYLMIALYRSGRTADSLCVYHQLRKNLAEEIGLEPGSEVTRLQGAILTRDPMLENTSFLAQVS